MFLYQNVQNTLQNKAEVDSFKCHYTCARMSRPTLTNTVLDRLLTFTQISCYVTLDLLFATNILLTTRLPSSTVPSLAWLSHCTKE